MSDADDPTSGAHTTAALRGRTSYWDAQSRHFEGLRLLYMHYVIKSQGQDAHHRADGGPRWQQQQQADRTRGSDLGGELSPADREAQIGVEAGAKVGAQTGAEGRPLRPQGAGLPAWTVLADDDSYVNVPHLLRYASRFDPAQPLLIGHVLDGVWPAAHTFSGGAGLLISREALGRFGEALAAGTMPLPAAGVANDEHIVRWALKLQVHCVHSNAFSYSALPADARVVGVVAQRLGREIEEYTGPNSPEGMRRRAAFTTAALARSRGALDAQVLGAVVLHRVPEMAMHALHAKLTAHVQASGAAEVACL